MIQYTVRHNRALADKMRERSLLLGLIVKIPGAAAIEAAGCLGYDLIVLDTEHGIADVGELEHHLRAADCAGIDVLVRVGSNDPVQILHALDSGAAGIVVPHVSTADQAAAAVASAHYPPVGTRGLAISTRAGGQSTVSLAEHLRHAREQTVVVAQLEDTDAVKAAPEIAATPGITAVWPGPSDLSLALGYPGEFDHPEVVSAVDTIIESTRDEAALCAIASDEADARAWRQRGASTILFALPPLLAERLRNLAAHVRSAEPTPQRDDTQISPTSP